MYRQHDFNKITLAPMECVMSVYNEPATRRIWDEHAIDGYYIKTSWENYWFYKIWAKNTRIIQVADMVFFKHHYITITTVSKADVIVAVAKALAQVIKNETPTDIGETEREQLTQLATIFNSIATNFTAPEADKKV